jgi:hypothetical protein
MTKPIPLGELAFGEAETNNEAPFLTYKARSQQPSSFGSAAVAWVKKKIYAGKSCC